MPDHSTSSSVAGAPIDRTSASNPPPGFKPIVHSSPFGAENGPFFESRSGDSWIRGFRVLERHTNAGGIAHGGMLMTFADVVLAQAVIHQAGQPAVTVRMTSDFLAPARLGDWVEGTAEVTRVTRSMAFVEGRLKSGSRTLLTASAVFQMLHQPGDTG
jgi:uncharacterized protein (TIGR00369 family)